MPRTSDQQRATRRRQVRQLARAGGAPEAIARQLRVDPRTVERDLRALGLDAPEGQAPPAPGVQLAKVGAENGEETAGDPLAARLATVERERARRRRRLEELDARLFGLGEAVVNGDPDAAAEADRLLDEQRTVRDELRLADLAEQHIREQLAQRAAQRDAARLAELEGERDAALAEERTLLEEAAQLAGRWADVVTRAAAAGDRAAVAESRMGIGPGQRHQGRLAVYREAGEALRWACWPGLGAAMDLGEPTATLARRMREQARETERADRERLARQEAERAAAPAAEERPDAQAPEVRYEDGAILVRGGTLAEAIAAVAASNVGREEGQ